MRIDIDSEFTQLCKKYSIGDMSKLLSISAPTIRFYDQEGIVVPQRGDYNSYRKYTVVDGNYLLKTKELKNAGFSIPDTKLMLNHYNLEQFKTGLESASEELRGKISQLCLYQKGLEQYIRRCELCTSLEPIVDMQPRPAMFRYTHQINDEFIEGAGRIEELKKWTDLLPLTCLSFKFYINEIKSESSSANLYWGFSVSESNALGTGLEESDFTEIIPTVNAIHMIFVTVNEVFLKPQFFKPVLEYADRHNFALCGDVVGNSLARIMDNNGNLLHYYEVWFPVSLE